MGLRLLAVACLVGAALAGPLQRESQCATRCPSSPNDKFNYEPGRKYIYDYKGVNHVVVAGQRKQKTQITTQVEISVKSKCEFILQMRNTAIEHKAPWEETAELVRKLEIPLPYAFEDGQIEHLCPSTDETKQSLNIKRAVLSAFINSMDSLDESKEVKEVDSLGTCQTRYTSQRGRQTIIEKEKDLKSCTNRHSSITSLMANQYESPESAIHTIPIFPKEKLTCREVIEGKIIKSVECRELSTIKPLTNRDSLIELEGQMDLKLVRVVSAEKIRIPSMRTREQLLFSLDEETTVEDKREEVESHLREMCSKNTNTIDLAVSKDFIELVAAVKRLRYESLYQIYNSLESGSLCSSKKLTDLFLDTLPMAGNDAAVKLMVNLLLEEKVSGLKAKLWTASLSLVSHPSQEAIAAVVPLIKKQKTGAVLLGVSAMVYRYCVERECESNPSVREIVSTLNEVLGRQCSFDNENEAIAVLKAFGNMGQLINAEQNILACAQDSDKSIRVRLSAIDAFRRVNKKKPEALLRLYADTQENYEVRIAALNSVLHQADRQQIQIIKSILEQEADEQVSAYAATLISNFNKTSSPLKKQVKKLLGEMSVKAPETSYWENSKNIEMSTFSEPLNVGVSVESDVIHATNTKMPRSMYTRFDMDVFDKHINIFELGMRAEGLEAAFKKLIGFQEAKKQKSSWNLLSSSTDNEEDKIQASLFFRTMNTEIFDLSVDDLTGMGEMIKIADVLNKVSHDKSADFSHSFMFINSKLIIPSVTGRSYSFGMTGSATVGLTASSKLDIVNIMSKPKNCDVHGHFQPSVNVEIAATVGIHSEKPRPDVKIITRLHSESDIEAQFKIKDGHLGLVKVSVPSENIALARISSDIVEIDANHQEKPVYETMQTKVDYCFDKLEKPLGVSICGKWAVPRPFMSKTFPFVKGVGNVELSIKKTDSEMKGYEISFEIPKHKSHHMKYSAMMDTPGSRINRRFAADLEVRTPSRDLKEFTLQVTSPFRSASALATGSMAMHRDLLEGSVDVQLGTSRRYSIKASTPISETASQKIYRPSVQVSSTSFKTLKVDGSVTVTKGRKQEVSFDLKCNKPSTKPLALKGTIIKDGRLSWSRNAEWKLSSDVALKTPLLNLQIRSSTEKQSKLAQTLATSLTLDYQKERSQRQSVKFTTKFQKNSAKISSVAQFEASEYPATNFALTWNMQGKLSESLKNDISLKYGRNPERQYINILQASKMYESQPGECKVSIKAPEFNIDSDVSTTFDIRKNSRLHAEVDLRYKEDKHIRSKLQLDNISERPLKLKIKAEIQTPSRRIMYQDELEEIESNSYKGNAILEWRADKRAEFQYKYQKKSDRSKLHHEIETTLRLPNSRSPIKNKASIQMSRENLAVEGRLSLDRKSEYSLTAHLNKKGTSYVSLKMPKVEGNLKLINDQDKKAADLDMKLNFNRRPRHIIAASSLELKSQKKIEIELALDADRKPDQKFLLTSVFEKSPRNKFSARSQLQVLDKVRIEMSAEGDLAIYGNHEVSVQTSLFASEPVEIKIKHELSSRKIESVMRFSKGQRPKVELSAGGEYLRNSREFQLSTFASVESLDNKFPTKKWNTQCTLSRSRQFSLKSNAKLEWSPSKVYESEISYDFQPDIMVMKAFLHTPHRNFEKQLIGFSFRKSESLILSSATLELSNGKSIYIESASQMKTDSISSSLTIRSPFDIIKEAKAQLVWENQKYQKSLKTSVVVNGEMLAEAELNMKSSTRETEINGRVKTSTKPELSMRITIEKNRESFKYDAQIMKESSNLMSATLYKQASGRDYTYALESKHREKTLINLKVSKEKSQDKTLCMVEAQGPFPHVSLALESSRKDRKSLSLGIKACQKSEEQLCYSIKVYHKALLNEENYRYYRKITLDIEKTVGNASPVHVANINVVASIKENEIREKFIIETKDKKIGYQLTLHRRDNENDHCSLDAHIFMAQRTARIKGSLLHNARSVLLDFEAVPDVSVPSRKFGLELKKEMASKEVSGYAKMIYPGLRKAIELSGRIEKEGMMPVGGKVRLDSSVVGGKVFVFEIAAEKMSRRQNRRSIEYRLYSEDQTTVVSAKLTKHITREESLFAYEWSFKTQQQQQREGKMSLRLYEKRNGIPRAVEVEIVSPRVTSKLNCRMSWESQVPTAMHMYFESNNQKLIEISMSLQDRCLVVEESHKSREFMKNQICIWKKENTLKVISVQSYYQSRRCLEFDLEVDQTQPQLANINLKWDRRNFELALREVRQLIRDVNDFYITSEDIRAMKQVLRSGSEKAEHIIRDVIEKVRQILQHHYQTVKEHAIKAKHLYSSKIWEFLSHFLPLEHLKSEMYEQFVKTVGCVWDKYVTFVRTHLPQLLRNLWEQTRRDIAECLKSNCPKDSFCYEVANMIENFELQRAKMMVSRKVRNLKRSMAKRLECVEISDVMEYIEKISRAIREQWRAVVEKFYEGDLIEKITNYVREMQSAILEKLSHRYEKFVEWLRRMVRHAEEDEDFRVLKSLVEETKEKAIQAWDQRDTLLQNSWEPLKETLSDYPRKWVKERMTIRKFAPKEGNIQIQLQHPLQSKHLMILKNALVAMKNRILSEKW